MNSNQISNYNSTSKVSSVPVVVTQGEATVKKTPDQAWLTVTTETREEKADEARRKSAQTMTTIQTQLLATGLSTDAIKTTGYRLTPEMEWKSGRGTVKGYLARNQIEVRVDKLDKLGDVIDAANATRDTTLTITGPRFTLKDEQAAQTEALQLAVQAALTRAKAIAAGAGKTLGDIVRIEEQNLGVHVREPYIMRTAMGKREETVETPIVLGDIEVKVTVALTAQLR